MLVRHLAEYMRTRLPYFDQAVVALTADNFARDFSAFAVWCNGSMQRSTLRRLKSVSVGDH